MKTFLPLVAMLGVSFAGTDIAKKTDTAVKTDAAVDAAKDTADKAKDATAAKATEVKADVKDAAANKAAEVKDAAGDAKDKAAATTATVKGKAVELGKAVQAKIHDVTAPKEDTSKKAQEEDEDSDGPVCAKKDDKAKTAAHG
jgi:hypothetical protein